MLALWRKHRLLVSAFSVTLALTLFFLGHLAFHIVRGALHKDEPIAPWMTVGYVARNVGLSPRVLGVEAGMPPPRPGHPQTLQEIADERGVTFEVVIGELDAAIGRLKTHPPKDAKP